MQTPHELRARVSLTISQKAVVLQRGILRLLDVQAELKGHLLIRPEPIERRNRGVECTPVMFPGLCLPAGPPGLRERSENPTNPPAPM